MFRCFNHIFQREEDADANRELLHSWQRSRVASLQLSQRKIFKSAHRAGVSWLSLDAVEHRYLLSCAADASIAIYDTQEDKKTFAAKHEPVATIKRQQHPDAHRAAVSAAIWYPVDTGIFLSGGRDGKVKVWDANALQAASAFELAAPVFAIAMASNPAASTHCLVAVGSGEPDVRLCDIMSGGFTHRLTGHREAVWVVAWSVTNEWELLTGGRDGQLRIWDVRRAGTRAVLDMHDTQHRQQAAVRRSGGAACPASPPRAAGAQPAGSAYAKAHGAGGVTGATPTPDGLYWISAGNDDRVRLWDAATRRHELLHYPDTFNRASKPRQLAVTDDGCTFFNPSGSVVQVLGVRSGAAVGTLTGGHFESVNSCCWNPAAQELYTGGNDNHIVVWAPRELARLGGGVGEEEDEVDKDAWSD